MSDERTEIPEGWTSLQWKQQVVIAQSIADDLGKTIDGHMTGAMARAIINGEINRRAQEDNLLSRSVLQPDIPDDEPTMPIRLVRDTWLGEQRVRANGQVVQWPIQDAKRLFAAGVANRADPLPGE